MELGLGQKETAVKGALRRKGGGSPPKSLSLKHGEQFQLHAPRVW